MYIMTQEMQDIQTRRVLECIYQNTNFTTVPVTEEYDADIDWDWYAGKYEKSIFPDAARFCPMHLDESTLLGKDNMGVPIYAIPSLMELPDWFFKRPRFSVLLPKLPKEVAYIIGVPAKPILLKKNIIERNQKHTEIGTKDNREILTHAVYYTDIVIFDCPQQKPTYRVVVKYGSRHAFANLDFTSSKRYIEIVDWRLIDTYGLIKTINRACKNGGYVEGVRPLYRSMLPMVVK